MVRFVIRSALTVVALLALYAVIPIPGQRTSLATTVVVACLGLILLAYAFLVLAQEARSATRTKAIRLEVLVAVLYTFVVFISLVYLALASQPGQFAGMNTRVDALYFTVSTIATVGFGDVHATGQASRALVTVQMFCDIVFIALVARIIVPSVVDSRAKARASALDASEESGGPDATPPTAS